MTWPGVDVDAAELHDLGAAARCAELRNADHHNAALLNADDTTVQAHPAVPRVTPPRLHGDASAQCCREHAFAVLNALFSEPLYAG
ncbi:MAG: hypothetical protein R6W83_05890 [Cryobacterium sp.]